MRLLLDENMPEELLAAMAPMEAVHMRHLGWAGRFNGDLLNACGEAGFAAFVTVDKNMPYQQNIKKRPFALIVMDCHPIRLENLLRCLPGLKQVIQSGLIAGEVYTIKEQHSD